MGGAPAAGLTSNDFNGSGGATSSREFIAESNLRGVVVNGLYQALITGLRTEAMRRRGAISRAVQIHLILGIVMSSMRQGALTSVALSVLLLVFPWLAAPLSLAPSRAYDISAPSSAAANDSQAPAHGVGRLWIHPTLEQVLAPNPPGESHPHPVEIDLPAWNLSRGIALRRWLLSHGSALRTKAPESLRHEQQVQALELLALG